MLTEKYFKIFNFFNVFITFFLLNIQPKQIINRYEKNYIRDIYLACFIFFLKNLFDDIEHNFGRECVPWFFR